ncbi:MAG: LysR substrate-binding domain-containing protein [Rickettsiales bacterium]|nr:LysR substrate-binding domain-containing protein [Rickettsiales bacterium]
MNIRDMEYLVTVADLSSFSRAAEQCNVSQPTLSAQIKKLEQTLQTPIFERSNKKVMVTETGAEIIKAARRLLHEAETIREIGRLAQDPRSGTFRLGAFPTLSTYIFPQLVPLVKEALPKLRLILVEDKTAALIKRLKRGELDAALIALPITEDSLVSKKLFEDKFRLAVPLDHKLAQEPQVRMTDLSRHRLLLLEEGHCLRDQAMEVCQLTGAAEQDFRATGLETLRQMVKAGTGITLMPEIAISGDETGIHYLSFQSPAPRREIGLVWRKTTARTTVIEEMIDLLVA